MRILYAVTSCSNKTYSRLFANVTTKPAYHSQKYHRLIMEGLAAHTQVDALVSAPVNASAMERQIVHLPSDEENGVSYHYLPAIRNSALRAAVVALGTFGRVFCRAGKDTAVVVDCLNGAMSFSAMLAARLRGRPCVCIVTDLPDMLHMGGTFTKIANATIRHSTHYVLLTEAMADYLQVQTKPYVVLEGQSDAQMEQVDPAACEKLQPPVCLYAGAIKKLYGLDRLLEGFHKIQRQDVRLHLYGPCDFEEELLALTREDPRIYYGGMILNTEIVEKEMEATLLVNPRPTTEEYVKYSFPSKTMEYMSTGTPVLTTVLPGMPKEYYPHVYLLEDESPKGITEKLTELFALEDAALRKKGLEARAFILGEKNNVVQAKKLLELLNKTRK